MLTIKNLMKSYGGRILFENAKLTVNWGERIALVGPNGAGKSTIFRIVLGQEEADQGTVDRDDYAVTGFLSQESGDPGDDTVLMTAMSINEEMGQAIREMKAHEAADTTDTEEYGNAQDVFNSHAGYQIEAKAKKILAGLGYKQEQFEKPLHEFSGGWIMRAHLARLLCLEPDLLMLDEPTNHLDLMSLIWFQRYLQNYPGAIFLISHDLDFMDAICESVIEIDQRELVHYTGNYSSYVEQRGARYESKVKAYRNYKKQIDHMQEFVDRFRNTTSKASQVQSKVKEIAKIPVVEKPIAPRKVFKFNFPQPPKSNQKVIEVKSVHKAYGEKVIYENVDLMVEKGERTVLIGPNGAGKSTLLKMLAGTEKPTSGEVEAGYATKIGYYSQHRTELLTEDNTVLEEIMNTGDTLREEDARSLLGSFLFRREDVHKRIKVLSGGEKSRLNLVKFLVDPPNLLLMDEPTTHLDIISIQALVTALKQFEVTLVFISHDVHFIRALADKTLHIANGKITTYAGGYDYYLEKSGLLDDERMAITA